MASHKEEPNTSSLFGDSTGDDPFSQLQEQQQQPISATVAKKDDKQPAVIEDQQPKTVAGDASSLFGSNGGGNADLFFSSTTATANGTPHSTNPTVAPNASAASFFDQPQQASDSFFDGLGQNPATSLTQPYSQESQQQSTNPASSLTQAYDPNTYGNYDYNQQQPQPVQGEGEEQQYDQSQWIQFDPNQHYYYDDQGQVHYYDPNTNQEYDMSQYGYDQQGQTYDYQYDPQYADYYGQQGYDPNAYTATETATADSQQQQQQQAYAPVQDNYDPNAYAPSAATPQPLQSATATAPPTTAATSSQNYYNPTDYAASQPTESSHQQSYQPQSYAPVTNAVAEVPAQVQSEQTIDTQHYTADQQQDQYGMHNYASIDTSIEQQQDFNYQTYDPSNVTTTNDATVTDYQQPQYEQENAYDPVDFNNSNYSQIQADFEAEDLQQYQAPPPSRDVGPPPSGPPKNVLSSPPPPQQVASPPAQKSIPPPPRSTIISPPPQSNTPSAPLLFDENDVPEQSEIEQHNEPKEDLNDLDDLVLGGSSNSQQQEQMSDEIDLLMAAADNYDSEIVKPSAEQSEDVHHDNLSTEDQKVPESQIKTEPTVFASEISLDVSPQIKQAAATTAVVLKPEAEEQEQPAVSTEEVSNSPEKQSEEVKPVSPSDVAYLPEQTTAIEADQSATYDFGYSYEPTAENTDNAHGSDQVIGFESYSTAGQETQETSAYEPQETTSYEPYQATSYEPYQANSYEPDQANSYEPDQANSYEPDQTQKTTSYEPEHAAATSYEPHQESSYEPHQATSYEPQQETSYEPHQATSYKPQQATSYEPQQNAYEPQQAASYEPQQNAYESQKDSTYEPQQNAYEPQQNAYKPQQSTYEPEQSASYEPYNSTGYEAQPVNAYEPQQYGGYEAPASTNYNMPPAVEQRVTSPPPPRAGSIRSVASPPPPPMQQQHYPQRANSITEPDHRHHNASPFAGPYGNSQYPMMERSATVPPPMTERMASPRPQLIPCPDRLCEGENKPKAKFCCECGRPLAGISRSTTPSAVSPSAYSGMDGLSPMSTAVYGAMPELVQRTALDDKKDAMIASLKQFVDSSIVVQSDLDDQEKRSRAVAYIDTRLGSFDESDKNKSLLWRVVKSMMEYPENALGDGGELDKSIIALVSSSSSENSIPGATEEHLDQLQVFLTNGDREGACQFANEHDMWAHSLIIANSIKDDSKDLFKKTVTQFINRELFSANTELVPQVPGDKKALRMLYSVFNGAGADAVSEYVKTSFDAEAVFTEETLQGWQSALSLILANRSANDQSAIQGLGDQLKLLNNNDQARLCYLLSPDVSGLDNSKMIGEDIYSDLDALYLLELYEFASKASIQQDFKLVLAWWLTDLGFADESKKYIDSITNKTDAATLDSLKQLGHVSTAESENVTSLLNKQSFDALIGSITEKVNSQDSFNTNSYVTAGYGFSQDYNNNQAHDYTGQEAAADSLQQDGYNYGYGYGGGYTESADATVPAASAVPTAVTSPFGKPKGLQSPFQANVQPVSSPFGMQNPGAASGAAVTSPFGQPATNTGESNAGWWGASDANQTEDQYQPYQPETNTSYQPDAYTPAAATPAPAATSNWDDDDDLGFGNSKPKKKPEQDDSNVKTTDSTVQEKPNEVDSKKDKQQAEKPAGGWGIFSLFGGRKEKEQNTDEKKAVKANLGEESSFYYDEKEKRWVNKLNDAKPTVAATPPPPKATTPQPPAAQPMAPPLGGLKPNSMPPPRINSAPNVPSVAGGIPNAAPPSFNTPPANRRAAGGARKPMRSRYVDVFNTDQK